MYKSHFPESSGFLYHTTLTKNVSKIKAKGLLMLQTTLWRKQSGERYGEGEIYAFENFTDAVRWGAKMEWDFKLSKPEDVSILKIKNKGEWVVDKNDPMGQMGSSGRWMKLVGHVEPGDIVKVLPLTRVLIQRMVADEDLTNEF